MKVKVGLSLSSVKDYAMKTFGGSGSIAPTLLTSALDIDEFSASHSCPFTTGETTPCTH
jgi:hypothetical protein